MKIYGYKKCSTVQKAIKYYQEDNEIEFFDFVAQQLPKETLVHLIEKSGEPINKFFNTRGVVFKELDLKNKLDNLNDDEKIELLLSDGKLIKRPLIETENEVKIGFKPNK